MMWKHHGEASFGVKKEVPHYIDSRITHSTYGTLQETIQLSPFSEEDDSHEIEETDDQSVENTFKQLVAYDPTANAVEEPVPPQPFRFQSPVYGGNHLVLYDPVANADGEIGPVPTQPLHLESPAYRGHRIPQMPSRALPAVGAFTIQCNSCFKWRLIPTKEKYEEIREHILEQPFYCKSALEWRPNISCDDPTDLSQDGSRLWAIDKPNIAQPPRGWQRLLRIRGEGSTKFADIYYVAPSGKRLRSMVEIQKYLMEHPEYLSDGAKLSRFSFQIPRPLQEDYVRKRPACMISQCDDPKLLVHGETSPRGLSWTGADDLTEPRPRRPALPVPPCPGSDFFSVKKKQTQRIESKCVR